MEDTSDIWTPLQERIAAYRQLLADTDRRIRFAKYQGTLPLRVFLMTTTAIQTGVVRP